MINVYLQVQVLQILDSQALRLRCIRRTSRTYASLLTLGLRREFEPLRISIGRLFRFNVSQLRVALTLTSDRYTQEDHPFSPSHGSAYSIPRWRAKWHQATNFELLGCFKTMSMLVAYEGCTVPRARGLLPLPRCHLRPLRRWGTTMVGGSDSSRGVVPWFQAKLGTGWHRWVLSKKSSGVPKSGLGSLLVWSSSRGLHCDICDVCSSWLPGTDKTAIGKFRESWGQNIYCLSQIKEKWRHVF